MDKATSIITMRRSKSLEKKIVPRLRRDFIVKVCKLPEGKDPNSSSRKEIEEALKGG